MNAPVVLGDGWEQLKKGVGQHLGTADPGSRETWCFPRTTIFSASIFRDLDKLKKGDEIIIITQDRILYLRGDRQRRSWSPPGWT